jgi:hypothetical protein
MGGGKGHKKRENEVESGVCILYPHMKTED